MTEKPENIFQKNIHEPKKNFNCVVPFISHSAIVVVINAKLETLTLFTHTSFYIAIDTRIFACACLC